MPSICRDLAIEITLPTLAIDLHEAARRSESLPPEWDAVDIDRAITRYLCFLHLVAQHPGEAIAPTRDIDVIWHLHMLSPRAYHADCTRLFGELLDHDGGFGQEPEEVPVLARTFERTAARWEATFGVPYVEGPGGSATKCWHDCQGRCWHACKSVESAASST